MAFDIGRCASLSKDGRAGVYIRRGIAPPFCTSKIFVADMLVALYCDFLILCVRER